MKILHFSPSCYPDSLGTGRRLAQLLLNDGNSHYFLVPATTKQEIDRNWQKHENLFRKRCRYVFRLPPEIPVLSRYLKVALNNRRLSRAAPATPDYDLVVAHTPLDFALPALGYARRHGLPLAYEIHTLYYDGVADRRRKGVPGFLNALAKKAAWFGERTIIRAADAIIVQTGALLDRVAALYRADPDKIFVVPNGIDVELFDSSDESERQNERREKGWNHRTVILYSGYLDRINGVDFLLRAAGRLPEELKIRSRLVIAGDGPLIETVRRRAAAEPDFIEFLGRIDHRLMPRLYAAADVFVIPRPATDAGDSLVPIKLLEAMAAAKAILASDLASFRETLDDGRSGILFRREDEEDFRRRLASLIGRPDRLEPLGRIARERVGDRYDWKKSRRLLQAVFRRLE